ncbi:hypothetical protein SARC_08718, partial [Sphaeroforma arctica JP610]
MEDILEDLCEGVFIYIDDVILRSMTEEGHGTILTGESTKQTERKKCQGSSGEVLIYEDE